MVISNMQQKSVVEEFMKIALVAKPLLPHSVDGREAILAMKNGGSRNWRQMEWIGFWFEFFIETAVQPKLGNSTGPSYGNTTFDLRLEHVWDLKAHPSQSSSLILNDQEAVRHCIKENSGVGFIIVEGLVEYDDPNSSFKKWHDALKGKQSDYEAARIARNAPSRRRKTCFQPEAVYGIWISSIDALEQGQNDGWISGFQKDMRNSDGKPRRAKFMFNTSKIPETCIVGSMKL